MSWVEVLPAKRLNGIIAHLPGVMAYVDQVADEVGDRARGNLSAHRLTGHSRIEVDPVAPGDKYGEIDAVVWLVDEGGDALAIELGHSTKNGKWVEGKHVLTNALGSG